MCLRAVLGFIVVLLASTCAPKTHFAADGYRHLVYPYGVLYEDPAANRVLGPEWLLDNFYGTSRPKPKRGADYEVLYSLDTNGDGEDDKEISEPAFDLRFTHARHAGIIWLRTLPISHSLRDKELRVLSRLYVDSIAGAGFEVTQLSRQVVVSRERRYAANMIDEAPAKLAGQDTHVVTVDVANVDQVSISPEKRIIRVRIVLARTPFAYRVGRNKNDFPVLMIAGYANLPEDFERSEKDFDRFLDKIVVEGRRGYVSEPPQRAEANATADRPSGAQGLEVPSASSRDRDAGESTSTNDAGAEFADGG
jgi:hypothetical protein